MDAQGLTSSQRKLVMWYKVKELKSKGLHCAQIARELGLHRHTVEKYVKMSLAEFQASEAYERDFKYKLDIFEEEVKNELIRAPYLSSRQVHDHLYMAAMKISTENYNCRDPKILPAAEKIELARRLYFDYNAGEKQLQRLISIDANLLKAIL